MHAHVHVHVPWYGLSALSPPAENRRRHGQLRPREDSSPILHSLVRVRVSVRVSVKVRVRARVRVTVRVTSVGCRRSAPNPVRRGGGDECGRPGGGGSGGDGDEGRRGRRASDDGGVLDC